VHEDASWLIKVDVNDFFHSIDERQIYREFRRRGVQKYRSFALARILTRSPEAFEGPLPRKYRVHRRHSLSKRFGVSEKRLGFLPQGAPTSGAISNMVCFDLDRAISEVSKRHQVRYTRYADDIILSGAGGFDRAAAVSILGEVRRVIERAGFRVNTEKTRILPPGSRLKVLGVLVGGPGLRLPKAKKTDIDNHLRAIEKYGFRKHAHRLGLKDDYTLLNRVYGNLLWGHEVNASWAKPRLLKLRQLAVEQLGDVKTLS
jgi:RNA-directed DNA polymerase